jgi:molybdopterin-guanine dinucleotide biosynthesis protein A
MPEPEVPLYGLVLAGGESTRMRTDKALTPYHGVPQALYCQDLLSTLCKRVFLSARKGQREESELRLIPRIFDSREGIGPLAGILSALEAFPEAAWMVLACDLPFMTSQTLEALVAAKDPSRFATAFINPQDSAPEPLCAIYEPKCREPLAERVAQGKHSPRDALLSMEALLIQPEDPNALRNVNTPEEYERAVAELRAG